MDLSLFTGFIMVSFTLACTPGADWAYIISSAISKRSFVPAVMGLLSGYLLHTALVAAGIAAVVAGSPDLLNWLTAAGALYLFWLGISTLRSWNKATFYQSPGERVEVSAAAPIALPSDSATTNPQSQRTGVATLEISAPKHSTSADFFKGLLTSSTNPKALLLYVALIPQFISASAPWALPKQTMALGLTHFAVSILIYFGVALTARALLRSRPLAARIVTILSGLIMIGLSIGLIFEQLILQ